MITSFTSRIVFAGAMLAWAVPMQLDAGLLTNSSFEAGLAGWSTVNQIGSEGSFFVQTGTESPLSTTTVPAAPGGIRAAMTDSLGPGSHVLYQDFIVPMAVPGAIVGFSLFINNTAPNFLAPAHLDFATPALNQQARVDITTTTADAFSVLAGDVLQTLFATQPSNPLRSGYNSFSVDITTLLQARQGQTLRLRFAEVDNVSGFNFGVDNADVNVVPEPSTWIMTVCALACLGVAGRRRYRA